MLVKKHPNSYIRVIYKNIERNELFIEYFIKYHN